MAGAQSGKQLLGRTRRRTPGDRKPCVKNAVWVMIAMMLNTLMMMVGTMVLMLVVMSMTTPAKRDFV